MLCGRRAGPPGGESIGRRFVRLPEGKRSLPSGSVEATRVYESPPYGVVVRAYERTFPGPVSSRVHGESLGLFQRLPL